ncbi:MAG: bacteriohemerythrin [Gammaproteobacteria bacterium]
MNKDEQWRAIRKRVFELTVTGTTTAPDLDALLERLFAILRDYRDLPLEPSGAVVLLNPRGRYFQVAQFGMEPAWKSHLRWDSGVFASAVIKPGCRVETVPFVHGEDGEHQSQQRLFLLPLSIDDQGIGYTVLFVPLDYQASSVHCDFMTDLAYALSGLVHRVLTNETLYIRELELEEARAEAIHNLGVASEYRDNETGWHIMRMTNYALAIAKAMGLPQDQRELLYVAAPMHDVGKIGIADAVLLKPGKLTTDEFEVMKTHTNIGVSILTGNDALNAAARDIAGSHHERWDGSGYPQGSAGEQIPLLARICSVADVFDALTSTRPYKKAWAVEEAEAYVISESGKYFDPAIVEAFMIAMPEILRVRELYRDDIIDPKQVLMLPPVEPRKNAWVPWHESLSVGIGTIDEHHRYLFDLINDLYEVVTNKLGIREVARLIKALDAYAKVHFRAEEQMMTHYSYEGINRQAHQHHAFEAKIREFYEELHANPLVAQFDVLSYLRDWLVKHILLEDIQLRSLVSA